MLFAHSCCLLWLFIEVLCFVVCCGLLLVVVVVRSCALYVLRLRVVVVSCNGKLFHAVVVCCRFGILFVWDSGCGLLIACFVLCSFVVVSCSLLLVCCDVCVVVFACDCLVCVGWCLSLFVLC